MPWKKGYEGLIGEKYGETFDDSVSRQFFNKTSLLVCIEIEMKSVDGGEKQKKEDEVHYGQRMTGSVAPELFIWP